MLNLLTLCSNLYSRKIKKPIRDCNGCENNGCKSEVRDSLPCKNNDDWTDNCNICGIITCNFECL
jgi:hypothetical protein